MFFSGTPLVNFLFIAVVASACLKILLRLEYTHAHYLMTNSYLLQTRFYYLKLWLISADSSASLAVEKFWNSYIVLPQTILL